MPRIKILIAVKTYPIPSAKYDELVCTAGLTETGHFIRLYPINFRDLPWDQQYKKYQWINVSAEKHRADSRKESYRPDCNTLEILGAPIPTPNGDWSERARYLLAQKSSSIEELREKQEHDGTSLGVFKPKVVHDLHIDVADPQWKPSFQQALMQQRLFEYRQKTKQLPRKVPFRFQYRFECNDPRCRGNHRMMIEDWELGALYWRLVDQGLAPEDAAHSVRDKFLCDICGPDKDTHFIVGTIRAHPKSWVVVGLFYPKKDPQMRLFP